MKEIPMLFSTPMAQAILEGRKTQTRRIIKPQPIIDNESGFVFDGKHKTCYKNDVHHVAWQVPFMFDHCRYKVGDILWVRETWTLTPDTDYAYKANMDSESEEIRRDYLKAGAKWAKWKPSIHMPRKACRLFLKIKSIRVERLQDISGYDVLREGLGKPLPFARSMTQATIDYKHAEPGLINAFQSLWQSINGEQSWNDNPFVWCIEFEKTEKPETHCLTSTELKSK